MFGFEYVYTQAPRTRYLVDRDTIHGAKIHFMKETNEKIAPNVKPLLTNRNVSLAGSR